MEFVCVKWPIDGSLRCVFKPSVVKLVVNWPTLPTSLTTIASIHQVAFCLRRLGQFVAFKWQLHSLPIQSTVKLLLLSFHSSATLSNDGSISIHSDQHCHHHHRPTTTTIIATHLRHSTVHRFQVDRWINLFPMLINNKIIEQQPQLVSPVVMKMWPTAVPIIVKLTRNNYLLLRQYSPLPSTMSTMTMKFSSMLIIIKIVV